MQVAEALFPKKFWEWWNYPKQYDLLRKAHRTPPQTLVIAIKQRLIKGWSYKQIEDDLGTNARVIAKVKYGFYYRHYGIRGVIHEPQRFDS